METLVSNHNFKSCNLCSVKNCKGRSDVRHCKKIYYCFLQMLVVTMINLSLITNLKADEKETTTTTNQLHVQKPSDKKLQNVTDANITGRVVNARTGVHIPYATIAISGTTKGCISDTRGDFAMRNLVEGTFTITAKYVGYKTAEKVVVIERNKTIVLNFELEEQSLEFDQIVVTATRNAAERKEAPAIVNVLSGKTFEITSSNNLAEAAAFQAGVRVEYNCSNCGVPQLLINGLQGEYSQILLNSRPVFSSLAAVYNIEQLPASMIERVEVIRGGGSALFGSNAIAGVVNIITKEPQYNSLYISNTLNVLKSGKVDNNVAFGGAFISDDNQTGVYLYGSAKNRQEYFRDDDDFSELPKLNGTTMGFRLTHNTGYYSKLIVEYHRINELRRGGNKFDLAPHQTDITEQVDHKINGGGLQYDIFSENQQHYLSLYASGQWIERASYFGTDGNPDAYGSTDDKTFVAGTQYLFTSKTPLILPFEFTFGFELTRNSLLDKMLGYDREIDQRVNIFGAYLQNEWKSENINFVIGGRLDKHNLLDKAVFSPRSSVRYSPVDWLGLRASYSAGYRAPQVYNEDLHVTAVGGEVALIELAAGLKPEYSNSFSISADIYKTFGDIQANLLFEGFYTDLNDVFSLVEQGRDAQNNLILLRENASGATVKGINIEGIVGILNLFEFQAGYTIQSSLYKESEVWSENPNLEPQNRMFRSPNHYGYLTATAYITDDFKASVFGKYTGSMLVQHFAGYIAEDAEVETPSFFDIGIKLNYGFELSPSLDLDFSIGVKNVLDQFQKDLDKGNLRDAGFIYGPLYPRTYFVEIKFNIH